MGIVNFGNGVASFGIPLMGGGGIPATFGKVFFVDYDNGNDGNNGRSANKAFKTIQKAIDNATTNANDVICLSAYSVHPQTTMLTVSKSRLHFIGLDGGRRKVDPRTRIELTGSTTATNVAALKVTGMGCSFTNLKIMNAHTVTESLYGVVAAGEDTVWQNCTIQMNAKQSTGATVADLLLQSTNDRFIECSIGNPALVMSAARNNVLCNAAVVNLSAASNCRFDSCEFVHWGSHADILKLYCVANGDIYDRLVFKNCEFSAKVAEGTIGTTILTNPPASLTSGRIWFINPALLDIAGICGDADKNSVYVNGPLDVRSSGISKNAQTSA